MKTILNLNDYQDSDDRRRFQRVLHDALDSPGTTVIVPPGDYYITTDLARKTMKECLLGVYGENPENVMFQPDFEFSVGLSLSKHYGTTIIGYGANLIIDGFMEPISIDNCKDVCICGLSIDHRRKPYSHGRIIEYCLEDKADKSGYILVRFDDAFPMNANIPTPRYNIYDYRTGCFNMDMKCTRKTWLGDNTIKFEMQSMPLDDMYLQEFYVWHSFHYRPAILIEDAENTILRDVGIHSQPGMGIVGHRCKDVLLDHVSITPSYGEHMSVNTDATHFTSSKGQLIFKNCQFEGHGDDVTNVHTFYHTIRKLDEREYEGSVDVHTHSLTLDYPNPGDTVELVDKATLLVHSTYKILNCVPDYTHQTYKAVLDGALPSNPEKFWVISRDQHPFLQVKGCITRNHWARAILIKTRRALIEDNIFQTSALQAIHIAAEAPWHEGGTCDGVIIRNNRFVHTGSLKKSHAGAICVEMVCEKPMATPQRNIKIEDNIFEMENVEHAITISNAYDVILRNNFYAGCEVPVVVNDSVNVINE